MNKLLIVAIIQIIGIIIGIYYKGSISFLFAVIFFIGLFTFSVFLFLKNEIRIKITKVIIVFGIGFLIINIYAKYVNNLNKKYNSLYKEFDNQEISIVCVIDKVVILKDGKYYTRIRVEKIGSSKKYSNTYLRLISKNKYNVGDRLLIKGTYLEPSTSRNPGGFSYKDYLKSKKIMGTIKEKEGKVISKNNLFLSTMLTLQLKEKMLNEVDNNLKEREAGLVKAYLLGETDNLEKDIKQDFRNSNLSHILAVSGMHVSYLILIINFIFNKKIFGKNKGNVVKIICLLMYIILIGESPSVLRAGICMIIYLVGNLIHRKCDFISVLSLSSIITLLLNPFYILNLGMLLSYFTTIGITLIAQNKEKESYIENTNSKSLIIRIKEYIKLNFYISISANLMIFPILIYYFNTISISFFVGNIIVSPIIAIALMLSFLGALLSLGNGIIFIRCITKIVFLILNNCLIILEKIVFFISKIPLERIVVVTPNIIFVFLSYGLIMFLYLTKTKRIIIKNYNRKKLIVILTVFVYLLVSIVSFTFIPDGNFKIYMIDVGQGDGILIITPLGKKILVDGGGVEGNSDYSVGENTLLPYLLDKKINSLDYIMISHFDSDHCEGAMYVMEHIKVKKVIISKQFEESKNYERFKKIVREKGIKVIVVGRGDSINIEKDLRIEFLWPDKENIVGENILNNNSIVCKLKYKKLSILFTGDVEEMAEKRIVELYGDKLKADIIKVAHHGSKTSSIEELIKAVSPRIAIIGVGKNNKFGHPNEEVIDRLKKNDTKIYRTDEMGEILLQIKRNGKISIDSYIK